MKNVLFTTILIVVLGCLGFVGLPWWGLAVAAALAVFIFPMSGGKSYLTGFVTGNLLWLTLAFVQNNGNAGLLSSRVGQLFLGLTSFQLLLITGLIGGLLAGFGALTGAYARQLVFPPKQRRYKRRYH